MNKSMMLVEERFDGGLTPLFESVGNVKKLYLKGVFAECEKMNINGRIYDRNEFKAVVDKINKAAADGRHILGHCDHPDHLDIILADVSHRLIEAELVGNQIICKAEILPTTKGKLIRDLIESNVQLGVSTRGGGNVNPSTNRVYGYDFVTVDIVATPSCKAAYPTAINESKTKTETVKVKDALLSFIKSLK